MQYRFHLVPFVGFALFVALTSHAEYGRLSRKPGFFGFTRACLYDWERSQEITGGCVTMFFPLMIGDSITAPVQTIIKVIDYMERPSYEPSSTNQQSDATQKGLTHSSESNSTKSAHQENEIPEERKVLQKLSLFMLIADDARSYLADRTSTPLLTSAVAAIRSLDPGIIASDDFTVESQKILELESQVLDSLNREF